MWMLDCWSLYSLHYLNYASNNCIDGEHKHTDNNKLTTTVVHWLFEGEGLTMSVWYLTSFEHEGTWVTDPLGLHFTGVIGILVWVSSSRAKAIVEEQPPGACSSLGVARRLTDDDEGSSDAIYFLGAPVPLESRLGRRIERLLLAPPRFFLTVPLRTNIAGLIHYAYDINKSKLESKLHSIVVSEYNLLHIKLFISSRFISPQLFCSQATFAKKNLWIKEV